MTLLSRADETLFRTSQKDLGQGFTNSQTIPILSSLINP